MKDYTRLVFLVFAGEELEYSEGDAWRKQNGPYRQRHFNWEMGYR